MLQLANQPGLSSTASQGYGFLPFGNSQLATMGSTMPMLMSAMRQMLQGLMGMNGGADSQVPMMNFGGQPGKSNGLSDFLGSGSAPSTSDPAA